MPGQRTRAALENITDDGQFEEIATAVLRITEPLCHGLAHPGTNARGRTKKSPVDAVTYAPGDPNHLIIVHHTVAEKLGPKWLLDPATVRRSTRSKSEPVAGDVVKTIDLVRQRRRRNPRLKATLILTTNREIDEDLMSDAVAVGAEAELTIDFWSGARIAHVLDHTPDGQWVRRNALGVTQVLLSPALLADISRRSLLSFRAGDDAEKRVPREFEDKLQMEVRRLTLVVGPSGFGKTVACHRALIAHVERGGFGLVLDHRHIQASASLEQAVQAGLKDFEPELASSVSALALASQDFPLLLLVEDVSRSAEPGRLLDKLVQWTGGDSSGGGKSHAAVRLICPVWPHLLSLGSSALERSRESATFKTPKLSLSEARDAVHKAAEVEGEALSIGQADAIANALEGDPLLIGLNRNWERPDAASVIAEFVDAAILRSCSGSPVRAISACQAFDTLGREMLLRRHLNLGWTDVLAWGLTETEIDRLETIITSGELMWLEGTKGRIQFRHDRIKAWLLARAATELKQSAGLDDDLVAEPAFAEIMGDCLVLDGASNDLIGRIVLLNPLALFACLARPGALPTEARLAVAEAAKAWLKTDEARGRAHENLRWEAMNALEYGYADHIPAVVDCFPKPNAAALVAKFRSGDVEGGLAVCQRYGLRSIAYWLARPIQAVQEMKGPALCEELSELLLTSEGGSDRRRAALILAGAIGDPALIAAVNSMWSLGQDQDGLLREYFWAFSRCATPSLAANILDPVCARWAALPAPKGPDEDHDGMTIWDFAAYDIREAFDRLPPEGALDYFIRRAQSDDLAWPIQYMLHRLDHPKAVCFIVDVLEDVRRGSTTAYFTSSLRSLHVRGLWDETNRPMSPVSRVELRTIWSDVALDAHRRIVAFDWWAASQDPRDLAHIRALENDAVLGDRALQNRMERGDVSAHPAFVEKLRSEDSNGWWWYARFGWSPLIAQALDSKLATLSDADNPSGLDSIDIGYTIAEILISIARTEAENILLRHWSLLSRDRKFIQVALFVGTPALMRLAEAAIAGHADPKMLFEHLSMTWGIRHNGHDGLQRAEQVEALAPYINLVESSDLSALAENCDRRGWFELRRKHLDPWMPETQRARTRAELAHEMDRALGRPFPMDFTLDHALEAGLDPSDVLATLAGWLPEQPSSDGLRVASDVIQHLGRREDVDLLELWPGDDQIARATAISNSRFAVARRTLS